MIDLCTYNAGNAKADRVAGDLRSLAARFPVVGLEEVADRKRQMNATGAQVLTGESGGEGHVALLVSAGTPIAATGYVPATPKTLVGRWGAGPKQIAPKGIRWARVTIAGTEVTVGVTHLVPSVQRKARGPIARLGLRRRRALYQRHIAKVVAWVESVTGPVVIVADWNATSDFPLLQPLRDAGLTCSSAPSHPSSKPTRDIDQLWSRGLDVVNTEALTGFSSDHRPVTASYDTQEAPPVPNPTFPDPVEKVTFRGRLMDNKTMYGLLVAEHRLGYELTVTQGCYSTAVGASAGTHAGGGVVDLAPWDQENKVHTLRDLGWAAWYRPAIAGLWPAHIHAVMIGHQTLSPEAVDQVAKYRRGEDGLADPPTPDPNPYRPDPEVVFDYRAAVRDERIRARNTSLRARIKTLRDRISANNNRITYK